MAYFTCHAWRRSNSCSLILCSNENASDVIMHTLGSYNRNKTVALQPREGVIIEWTQNVLFHDARDVILMYQTDVMEVEDDDDEKRYY